MFEGEKYATILFPPMMLGWLKNMVPLVFLLVGACGIASSATLLQSDFNTATDGWCVGALFSPELEPAMEQNQDGGRSRGYLQTEDRFANNAFRAPSSWLGNQSRLFGASLHFYQRAAAADQLLAPAVVLASGRTLLQYRSLPPTTDWTEFSVALEAGEWEIADGSGVPGSRLATDAEVRRVLRNLDWFAFSADWLAGEDLVGFDEVSIVAASAPEPAAFVCAAGGLAALGLATILRRSTIPR